MDLTRRLFLKSAAGTASALLMASEYVSPALAASAGPWTPWSVEALKQEQDPRIRAIAHAILVPNPQNLQPWLCELIGDDRIILRNSGERRLSVSDLPDRQLTVGFGTFSELLILAAQADGYAVDLAVFPDGEPWPILDNRPIAVFTLKKAPAKRDPLLDSILDRHTNRTPFDERKKVTAEQIAIIRAAARKPKFVHTNLKPELALRIQDITLRAWDFSMVTFAPTREEVARWTHIGNAAIAAAPYGPSFTDAALAKAAGPVTIKTLSDPNSAQFKANRAAYRKAVQTGWAHIWIAAPDGDREGMFDAGRDWMRLHLQATALGLNMQPHSQALQNFTEIEPYVREIHETLSIPKPGRIHMLGRIGYGSPIDPSPRLPVSAHIHT